MNCVRSDQTIGNAKVNDVISNAFERHAQTALVLLLVALLIWVGSTTQDTAVEIAKLRVELGYIKVSIEKPHIHDELSKIDIEIAKAVDELRTRVGLIEQREHE